MKRLHITRIYAGTSGYAYKEWKGRFYPPRIPAGGMLRFYSERLGAVEINNTFYRMPTENILTSWAEQVPADFVFAIKAPQVITHLKRLRNVSSETDYLFRTVAVLKRRLGPVLFQFPAGFRADLPSLEAFLKLIPPGTSCAFEFRSSSWFDPETISLLRRHRCSLCTADTEESPSEGIVKTSSWGYLRLRRSDYTDIDLSRWIERIRAQAWEKAFVFFKHEEGAKGPEMAMRFHEVAG